MTLLNDFMVRSAAACYSPTSLYEIIAEMSVTGRYATSSEIERLIKYFSQIEEAELRSVILRTVKAVAETGTPAKR